MTSSPDPMQTVKEPQRLDLKGLKCPLPALKTRKMLLGMTNGSEIEVICTDPMARIDIPHLVNTLGDRLVSQHEDGDNLIFRIERLSATM